MEKQQFKQKIKSKHPHKTEDFTIAKFQNSLFIARGRISFHSNPAMEKVTSLIVLNN